MAAYRRVYDSPAGWLPRTGISSETLRSVIEYGLPFLNLFLAFFLSRQQVQAGPRTITELGARGCFSCGQAAWNSLVSDVRAVTDTDAFKKRPDGVRFSIVFIHFWTLRTATPYRFVISAVVNRERQCAENYSK